MAALAGGFCQVGVDPAVEVQAHNGRTLAAVVEGDVTVPV